MGRGDDIHHLYSRGCEIGLEEDQEDVYEMEVEIKHEAQVGKRK